MNLTKYSKMDIANSFVNNLSDAKIILIKQIPKEIKRNMWKFSDYEIPTPDYEYDYSDYDNLDLGLNIHSIELPIENGYEGALSIDNIYIIDEDDKVSIRADEVTFYNNPLQPSDYKTNGFAIINNDRVISYEIFRSVKHIIHDDFTIRWQSELFDEETIQCLYSIKDS